MRQLTKNEAYFVLDALIELSRGELYNSDAKESIAETREVLAQALYGAIYDSDEYKKAVKLPRVPACRLTSLSGG